MNANQRSSFRIDQIFAEAELFYDGHVAPCSVHNVSAGGALVESTVQMPSGARCTLGLRLEPEMATAAGRPYLSFQMRVLDAKPRSGAISEYRLMNETTPGSTDYEDAAKFVVAAHRRALAQASGAEDASPMATRPTGAEAAPPRRKLRLRFGKRSMRPGSRD